MNHKTEQEVMQNWQGDITKPIVSVCAIAYNHEKYINEAIDSFLMQETNFPFEIVIGEDCSTDHTRAMIDQYVAKYPNIMRLVTSENNVGMMENGIRTILSCIGEYIALCEGDDYWTDKKKLQIQIDEMRKNKELGLSFHLASILKNNDFQNPNLKKASKVYTIKEIIQGDFHLVQTNTIVIKKECLSDLNYELLSKSPVGDVWFRIAGSIPGGALFINKIMSAYRVQSDGSWSHSIQENENFIIFVNKMFKSIDYFDKHWEYKYTKEFKFYKNMYIDVVIKKNITKPQKNDFIEQHSGVISLKNKLLWSFLYKHETLVNFLKNIKRMIKR